MNASDDEQQGSSAPAADWLVDGVSAAARDAAAAAAAGAGCDLGTWIEEAILDAASRPAVSTEDIVAAIDALGARIATAETTTRHTIVPLRDRLGRLSQQLADIERARTGDADGDGSTSTGSETT